MPFTKVVYIEVRWRVGLEWQVSDAAAACATAALCQGGVCGGAMHCRMPALRVCSSVNVFLRCCRCPARRCR